MLAAEVKFINFYRARKLLPLCAYGTASEFVKPNPGGAIASKAQQFFQGEGIDAGFAGGEPPHCFKPAAQGLFAAVKYGTGCK